MLVSRLLQIDQRTGNDSKVAIPLEHCVEKTLGPRVLRRSENLLRVPGLDDGALRHEHDSVGHIPRKAHFMGHDDHRHAVPGELPHDAEHLADKLGIERRGHLVEQHRLRTHRERACDRHTLLLATAQFLRKGIDLVGQPDVVEQRQGASADSLAIFLQDVNRRSHQVPEHAQMREQVEALEHHADSGSHGADLLLAIDHRLAV